MGHSRSLELTRIDPPSMTSYQRSIVIMGLSRTVSETDGDFSRKLQKKIPTPRVYFTPPMMGFPWNWVSAQRVKKLE